jgi:hypothetical protein
VAAMDYRRSNDNPKVRKPSHSVISQIKETKSLMVTYQHMGREKNKLLEEHIRTKAISSRETRRTAFPADRPFKLMSMDGGA